MITAKKDGTVSNGQETDEFPKLQNEFQIPKLLELLDSAAQIITSKSEGTLWFTSLDLKYAFSQLPLDEFAKKNSNFSIVSGNLLKHTDLKPNFFYLTGMPKEFQKTMNKKFLEKPVVFCFLDDILIVSIGSIINYNEIVDEVLSKVDKEGLALKLSKCEFSKTNMTWLGIAIDKTEMRPKISRIERMMTLQPPKSLKKLRSF